MNELEYDLRYVGEPWTEICTFDGNCGIWEMMKGFERKCAGGAESSGARVGTSEVCKRLEWHPFLSWRHVTHLQHPGTITSLT